MLEYTAAGIAALLTAGMLTLALLGRAVPPELSLGWGAAVGYVFGRHGNGVVAERRRP